VAVELIEVATTGAVKVAGVEDDDTQMWQVTVATVAIDHRGCNVAATPAVRGPRNYRMGKSMALFY